MFNGVKHLRLHRLLYQRLFIKINTAHAFFQMCIRDRSYNGRLIKTSADLAMFLLEEGHVACVGGLAFEAANYIRFSYATSDENIIEAMKRVKETLAKLK